ncbi:3-dehydroquinate synthase [Oscillospiraceae bacterium PP1C4]
MRTIEVKTGRPYHIQIESGLLLKFAELFSEVYGERKPRLAIITDDIVDGLYGQALQAQLEAAGYCVCKYAFPNGEGSKTLETVNHVYAFLAANSITRTDVIIALGGGVVGDLAGFAAATWLRGIEFVQVPTTFLATIDSSVGGKTGVDIPQGKNLVGAFWQPSLVVCDILALDTLSDEIFADGVAEAIKYGAILDEKLFGILENGILSQYLEYVICRCVDLKREIVEADEHDKGVRQWLNFGHTFGHAVEKQSDFAISHGKGVAIGMVLLTEACERQGITPSGCASRIAACCEQYGLPVMTDFPLEVLCHNCMGDKKRSGSKITLVTLEQIGKAALYPVDTDGLYTFMGGECHE